MRRYQYLVAFNSRKGPFNSPVVRRALKHAIDRDALIQNVLKGHGVASTGPLWPKHWAYNNSIASYRFDPGLAVSLLTTRRASVPITRSDGPQSARLRFTCLIPENFSVIERVALEVQKQLYNVGVDMQFEVVPSKEFDARIRRAVRRNPDRHGERADLWAGRICFWRSAPTFPRPERVSDTKTQKPSASSMCSHIRPTRRTFDPHSRACRRSCSTIRRRSSWRGTSGHEPFGATSRSCKIRVPIPPIPFTRSGAGQPRSETWSLRRDEAYFDPLRAADGRGGRRAAARVRRRFHPFAPNRCTTGSHPRKPQRRATRCRADRAVRHGQRQDPQGRCSRPPANRPPALAEGPHSQEFRPAVSRVPRAHAARRRRSRHRVEQPWHTVRNRSGLRGRQHRRRAHVELFRRQRSLADGGRCSAT